MTDDLGMSDKPPVSDIDHLRDHIAGVLLELHYEGDPGMLVNARDDADVLLRETERWLAYVPQRIVCGNGDIWEASRRLEERPPRHFTQEDQVEH